MQFVRMCVKEILYEGYPAGSKIISCCANGTGRLVKGATNSRTMLIKEQLCRCWPQTTSVFLILSGWFLGSSASFAPVVAWRSPEILQCLLGAPGRFVVYRTSTARAQEMTFSRPLTSSPLRKPPGPSVHKWVRTHSATPRKPCDTLSKAVSVYAVFYPDCIFLWSDCLEEESVCHDATRATLQSTSRALSIFPACH